MARFDLARLFPRSPRFLSSLARPLANFFKGVSLCLRMETEDGAEGVEVGGQVRGGGDEERSFPVLKIKS